MSLNTYDFDMAKSMRAGLGLPLRRLDDDDRHEQDLRPGDTVCHVGIGDSGYGMVVAVMPAQAVVLWSVEPNEFGPWLITKARQLGRPAYASPVARGLINVQPMPDPPAACLYFDLDVRPVTA